MQEIKGIIVPILTPMNEDESINLPELRNQIERMITAGVHGIFPFGTNGEGYILSESEKEAVLEVCVDQVKGRVPVYAGSGCISTRDTIRQSLRAKELGATCCPSLHLLLPQRHKTNCIRTTAQSRKLLIFLSFCIIYPRGRVTLCRLTR